MSREEQLREQIRTQEMDILRLRADNGKLAARVANLVRINTTQQNAIGALRRKLGMDLAQQAEAVFRQ